MSLNRLNVPLATLGECPRWDSSTQMFYWVDIEEHKLNRYDPATLQYQVRDMGEAIGCFALRKTGGFVVALRSGYALIDDFDAPLRRLHSPAWNPTEVRFNDGRCDPQGRFWAGTMFEPRTRAGAALYCLNPNYNFSVHGDPVTIANGIAVSPDEHWFYFADTPTNTVFRYAFDASKGQLGERTTFITLANGEGRPDGATVDTEGNYWLALFNGACVRCYSPAGKLLEQIDLPTRNPTCLTFGGPDLRTLFITTARIKLSPDELAAQPMAGAVFTITVAKQGLDEPRFAG
jgi:sugar lactone lactonase YvrE